MIRPTLLLASIALLALAGCDSTDPLVTPVTCNDAPLSFEDVVVGGQPNESSTVVVRYVGRLANGTAFDSTGVDINGVPRTARLSLGSVVDGFRLGIGGTAAFPEAQIPAIPPMRYGGRRIITIPPNLGYKGFPRPANFGTTIPACSTLIFDVTLVDAR